MEASKVSCDRANALQTLNDKLEKDNLIKEREIKRLREELQEREHTRPSTPDADVGCSLVVKTSEAQVAAQLCNCGPELTSGAAEQDGGAREQHKQRQQELEDDLKAARAADVRLRESVRALRAACAARDRRLRTAAHHSHFRDLIALELCLQLRAAKAQLREILCQNMLGSQLASGNVPSCDSLEASRDLQLSQSPSQSPRQVPPPRQQLTPQPHRRPRRKRHSLDSCKSQPPMDGSGDDKMSFD